MRKTRILTATPNSLHVFELQRKLLQDVSSLIRPPILFDFRGHWYTDHYNFNIGSN